MQHALRLSAEQHFEESVRKRHEPTESDLEKVRIASELDETQAEQARNDLPLQVSAYFLIWINITNTIAISQTNLNLRSLSVPSRKASPTMRHSRPPPPAAPRRRRSRRCHCRHRHIAK
jgi:hypothetical protein